MTGAESDSPTLRMLPPFVEQHPPLDFQCPHCAVRLRASLREFYRTAMHWTKFHGDAAMHRTLGLHQQPISCPACKKKFVLKLLPAIEYRAVAGLPVQGEKLVPGLSYWGELQGPATRPLHEESGEDE